MRTTLVRTAAPMLMVAILVLGGCSDTTEPDPPDGFVATQLVAGSNRTCALSVDNRLACWGNFSGAAVSGPTELAPELDILSINSGGDAFCLLANGPETWCWGRLLTNYDLIWPFASAPTRLEDDRPITSIAVAVTHWCGLVPDGSAYCWGDLNGGVRGTGAPVPHDANLESNAVAGGQQFEQLSATLGGTCGRTAAGLVMCWGTDAQLGTVTAELSDFDTCGLVPISFTACSHVPVRVESAPAFIDIRAGQSHICGLTAQGAVYCWGSFSTSSGHDGSLTPTRIDLPSPMAMIAPGSHYTCGLDASGRAFCWGPNNSGNLGRLPITDGYLPAAPVETELRFSTISAGGMHACGIERDTGAVFCWGGNNFGQLGFAESGEFYPTPIAVALDSLVAS